MESKHGKLLVTQRTLDVRVSILVRAHTSNVTNGYESNAVFPITKGERMANAFLLRWSSMNGLTSVLLT